VRPGDTLSAIAATLGIPGGWQALYAADERAIGPNPNAISPGTVLGLPGRQEPGRYAIAPGDTLSAIAVALGVRGGWQALYAANRRAVGPDPNVIRPGTVLVTPPAASSVPVPQAFATPPAPARTRHRVPPTPAGRRQPASSHGHAPTPAPAASRPSSQEQAPGHHQATPGHQAMPTNRTVPTNQTAPGHSTAAAGMPRWLMDVLIAAGILAATAFIAEPAAALARRRKHAPRHAPDGTRHAPDGAHPATGGSPKAPGGPDPAPGGPRPAPDGAHPAPGRPHSVPAGAVVPAPLLPRRTRIILADHERLIVTYCAHEHTVYVLTPPGQPPQTVLAAARLVLPQDTYDDLAGHLGIPATWPLE
jgi:LysM repeat protein